MDEGSRFVIREGCLGGGKVVGESFFEVTSFADVDNAPHGVFHNIDSWRVRRLTPKLFGTKV